MKNLRPHWLHLLVIVYSMINTGAASAQVLQLEATLLQQFDAVDARQGVAVDNSHFFAINNTRIAMHDKNSGEIIMQWNGGPTMNSKQLIHLDSGVVRDGLLYAAHSNYPRSPMQSSVESWNATTLEHVESHPFEPIPGSLTWLDFHQGHWWATFANYDVIVPGQQEAYGTTAATLLVKMNQDFTILQRWLFPPALHERFTPMSNSGGSWGADGFLYIPGHDHPEIYVLQIPQQGSAIQWLATVHVPWIEGQGIAWDRSADERIMWGITRSKKKVVRFSIPKITGL